MVESSGDERLPAPASKVLSKKTTKGQGDGNWKGKQFAKSEGANGTTKLKQEWLKLAELVLVQVHGSCEDERVFSAISAMSYLKSKYRNRLGETHLNVAARFFHQPWFSLELFPYEDALKIWHAAAPICGRYARG